MVGLLRVMEQAKLVCRVTGEYYTALHHSKDKTFNSYDLDYFDGVDYLLCGCGDLIRFRPGQAIPSARWNLKFSHICVLPKF